MPDPVSPERRRTPRPSAIDHRAEQPSFIKMVALVAVTVAVVILVFFGIGYLLGRIFL